MTTCPFNLLSISHTCTHTHAHTHTHTHTHAHTHAHTHTHTHTHTEGDLLADQVDSVKHAAELVSQLRRVGKGLGVYHFDKDLE